MIIIPVEEPALLVAVDGVVGGVEVEDQVLGRLGVRGDELIDQDLGDADQRLALDAVLQAAEGRRRGEGPLGIGASPAATCSTGSARRFWWSLRSS